MNADRDLREPNHQEPKPEAAEGRRVDPMRSMVVLMAACCVAVTVAVVVAAVVIGDSISFSPWLAAFVVALIAVAVLAWRMSGRS